MSSSSISSTGPPFSSLGGPAGDQRAHPLAADDPIYVAGVPHVEDVDGKVVVHAERERGRVHHLEPALDRLAVADRGDELGVRVGRRVGVVDALHPVLGHQDRLARGSPAPAAPPRCRW